MLFVLAAFVGVEIGFIANGDYSAGSIVALVMCSIALVGKLILRLRGEE